MTGQELALAIARAAAEKKASDIVTMDMRGVMDSTDYFVISSANTATQVRAIADSIEEELAKAGVPFQRKEGYREGEWVLLDYGDAIAHVFRTDQRGYYALERLWGDAKLTPFEEH